MCGTKELGMLIQLLLFPVVDACCGSLIAGWSSTLYFVEDCPTGFFSFVHPYTIFLCSHPDHDVEVVTFPWWILPICMPPRSSNDQCTKGSHVCWELLVAAAGGV